MNKPIVIANYLPQFYQTPENDAWWGTGFTEWTNVAKARPLFKGHYQPKIPADLGFYNLRNDWIREQQADMAKEAGITAFCYWHYWLGNGKRLLELPFNEVLASGKPDFPFCLGWANHDWQKKEWVTFKSIVVKEYLVKQEYGGTQDYIEHFNQMLPAFKDERYLKVDNRLLFKVFRPDLIPDTRDFFNTWNKLAVENGLPKFYFVACSWSFEGSRKYMSLGYDLVNLNLMTHAFNQTYTRWNIVSKMIKNLIFKRTNVVNYSDAIEIMNSPENSKEHIAPTIIPNWDHTPRSGVSGNVLHNSTPKLFEKHINYIFERIKEKKNKIVFLKSWNEWGEGNYMEPDLKYGKKYIEALARCLKRFDKVANPH